jgi:hypothetical protein
MQITHDEARSFFLVKTNYYRALAGTANTHWLNSFFIKIWSLVLGNAPGLIRIHLLIAFPFFAIGIFKLADYIPNRSAQLLFCCFVLLNPYVLDFFAVARGYGLALTFQAWLLLYFIKAAMSEQYDHKQWLKVFILSVFMIASNLSYLYSLLAVMGFLFYGAFSFSGLSFDIKQKKYQQLLWLFFFLILFTVADLMFIKFYGKDLEYGGDTDFVGSIFGSVWEGSLYYCSSPMLINTVSYLSLGILICGILYFCYKYFQTKKVSAGILLALVLGSIFILNFLFHVFLKNPFLIKRTALQWYVPGILLIFLFVGILTPKTSMRTIFSIACYFASGVILFFFVEQANLHYCFEWRFQSEAQNQLKDLVKLGAKNAAINNFGVFTHYYRLVDTNFAKLHISKFHDDRFIDQCDSMELKKLEQYDYIVIYWPEAYENIKKSNLKITLLKEYKYTPEKLVKVN